MFKLFFISQLATLMSTLGRWQGGSLTQPPLITALFQVRSEGHWEPHNKVWFQSLTERISGIREPSDSECNVLSHCITLPESVLETIGYRLASVLSRYYIFFSLTVTPHTHYLSVTILNLNRQMLAGKCFVNFLSNWYKGTCITIHRSK